MDMKRVIVIALSVFSMLFAGISAFGAAKYQYTEATALNVFNKLMPTENPWHRLDVAKYPGMTRSEQVQAKNCTGMSIAFRTNSPVIGVRAILSDYPNGDISPNLSIRGFDLYTLDSGRWEWAGSRWLSGTRDEKQEAVLLSNASGETREYILNLPMRSELASLEIITAAGSTIEASEAPFRSHIAVFGSSFTHGAGVSSPGMAYVSQLSRMTGLNFINMGFSGNSRLQPYFAKALAEADVDAYVFDSFSNPSIDQIKERLFPFIETIRAAKPGVPMIFMKTIRRQSRDFNVKNEKAEARRMEVADSLMKIAVKKYDDVYWVTSTDASSTECSTTTDGTHPNDYGYLLWAESVKKPICKILRKYGIR